MGALKTCSSLKGGWRRRISAALLLVAIAGVVARVAWLNAACPPPAEDMASTGQWLQAGEGHPDARGYSFRVESAQVMSPNEFLATYGRDGVQTVPDVDADEPTIIAVRMTIRNDRADYGGVDAWEWSVVGEGLALEYPFSSDLFSHVEPGVSSGMFSVKPGESYTTCLPFCAPVDMPYFSPAGSYRRCVVKETSFHLSTELHPVRKRIAFDVRG